MAFTTESPAAAETANGAGDHAWQLDHHVHTEAPSAEQDFPLRWVNDGARCIGLIYADGARLRAATPRGRTLGTFVSMADARAAILSAATDRLFERDQKRTAALGGRRRQARRRAAR